MRKRINTIFPREKNEGNIADDGTDFKVRKIGVYGYLGLVGAQLWRADLRYTVHVWVIACFSETKEAGGTS